CGAGYGARLSHTSVVLQLGPLAGGRGLDVEVASDTNGRPRLRFPGHPYAKLSTVVECQKVRP
ncbi:MAG TPA: hypothetical protein VFV50_16805, partial [Bdellovibrionales bacterium]|nr:hypothetical protein [Bdellovibrionales bacterium]